SHHAVADAVTEQATKGTHYGACSPKELEWAERVVQLVPSAEEVRFTMSGTEATLLVMRLARAYTGRRKILKFEGHFHGWHDHAVLLIFDEVVSGFRWSPGGVQQLLSVMPDLTTLAKIVSGGLPGGAVAGQRDIMQLISFEDRQRKIIHQGTFNANPLSAAAGCACLDIVKDPSVQEKADALA